MALSDLYETRNNLCATENICIWFLFLLVSILKTDMSKKGKRKVQGVPQSQTPALLGNQKEEKTDKSKQTQIELTYKKH